MIERGMLLITLVGTWFLCTSCITSSPRTQAEFREKMSHMTESDFVEEVPKAVLDAVPSRFSKLRVGMTWYDVWMALGLAGPRYVHAMLPSTCSLHAGHRNSTSEPRGSYLLEIEEVSNTVSWVRFKGADATEWIRILSTNETFNLASPPKAEKGPTWDMSRYPMVGLPPQDLRAILKVLADEAPDERILRISVAKDSVTVMTGEQRAHLDGKGRKYILKKKNDKWVVVAQHVWVS